MRINWAYKSWSHSYLSFINCSLNWCGIDVLIFARFVFFVGCLIFFWWLSSPYCSNYPSGKGVQAGTVYTQGEPMLLGFTFFLFVCLLLFLQEKTIFSFKGLVKVWLHCRPKRYSLGREMLHVQLKMQFCFVFSKVFLLFDLFILPNSLVLNITFYLQIHLTRKG